jgi:hypothetical protein
MPKTAKGQKFKFETSCVAWIDLLGYGSSLEAVHFDPTTSVAENALDRVRRFHEIVTKASKKLYPTFVLNDGAVAYRDLSPRSKEVTYDFISRSFDLFEAVNENEKKHSNLPGARMVIATGFRVRRMIDFRPRLFTGEAKSIRDRLDRSEITIDQALNQALMARHQADSTPELQHNFAFTKAYLAESSGSKAGLGGPNCFIDLSLFSDALPNWITISKTVDWSQRQLNAKFGQLDAVNKSMALKRKFAGALDAFEVAKKISPYPDTISRIRASKMGDFRAIGLPEKI